MKRTGTIERWRDANGKTRYRARIYLSDGSRIRQPLPAGYSEDRALDAARAMQEREDETGVIYSRKSARLREEAIERGDVVPNETAGDWWDRYLPTVECGENHRGKLGTNWSKWIEPVIGHKVMRTLSRDDVEDVRDALDRAIIDGRLRAKTALNVWSTLTAALKAASSARDRRLRVHDAPIHFAILPPRRGPARSRPWLYPSEWLALAACAVVPIEWRRTYAIAIYTGLRPNELRVLTWRDVDLVSGHVHVTRAWDEAEKRAKSPKTSAGLRTVPIEPELLPMLKRSLGKDDELVAPLLARNADRHASTLRTHLEAAEVDRARLWADTETEEPVDFRSLRDSYATWLALADVSDKRIQRRLGHRSSSTTDGYIKQAEAFDARTIGAPFPPLPVALLGGLLRVVA